MDNVMVIGIVTVIGAVMGTFIPYLLKTWNDPNIKFDINYGYALLVGVIVQVIALIPDSVPALTFKIVLTAFAAGYGLQAIINRVVPKGA